MGILDRVKLGRSAAAQPVEMAAVSEATPTRVEGDDLEKPGATTATTTEQGVQSIEAAQALWGKTGRRLIILGLALIMIIYEIDNSTVYVYNNYSTSEFGELARLATLGTATTILFSAVKPPIAKLSNVVGRGATYLLAISFYVVAYVLMASATGYDSYAAGAVLYSVGQSGTNIMNDVVISDITTARWRGFAIGVSFAPFLVTPWIAAFIVDSVVNPDGGIGWRWGIGMFAILMPFCASFIIATLLHFESRARKLGLVVVARTRMTVREFLAQVDIGGIVLFAGGLALLLVPLTLAATTPSQWQTPYLIALIVLGGTMLAALPFYEHFVATHPMVPVRYFTHRTILCCLLLISLDSVGFSATHTYLYAWATVAKGLAPRDATFFLYTNGVTQTLFGILGGLLMARLRRYKWLAVAGSVIRLIGYGVMVRLRGVDNSTGEIFAVQLVQGIGSGIIQTCLLVPAQISVPHAEMPQITALVVCFSILGSAVGACVAGGIYTNTLVPALAYYMPAGTTADLLQKLAGSITGVVPAWGTPERLAVAFAFSDVLRYCTYAALGASALGFIIALFLPDHELPDKNNLVED